MTVSAALARRRSVRDFEDRPVPVDLLKDILAQALRAPSGGNLQPWQLHLVLGDRMDQLKALMQQRVQEHPGGEETDYDIYPRGLKSPYRERRHDVGERLYAALGIPREDKLGRMLQFSRNFQFFGAPAGLFVAIDRSMGRPQWSDLGMLMLSVMLLLEEAGVASCAQECWAVYPKTVGGFLGLPQEQMLFAGMAIGYAKAAPVNDWPVPRAPLDEVLRVHGA
ncbi:MAG: nitroreductase [Aquabacterium sp.]|jgi:nitroreductase|nr:MAG: nitroreductase [Aquabacterium sp.]